MSSVSNFPFPLAYMACQFSPSGPGLTNIPESLPEGSMLILTDRMDCRGHSADLAVRQLQDAVTRLKCESILLDFQRPPEPEAEMMVRTVVNSLPCPVAVTEGFAASLSCPVFLSPGPLHMPLAAHLEPWNGRQIWLEAALCQEQVTVTESGTEFSRQFPPVGLDGGFYDELLCCHYQTTAKNGRITFTLFDTSDSLEKKLELAESLGVSRAIGLWQELGKM